MSDLSCFKAYDIRGEIGVNIDEGIAYRIGRAVAQHFGAQSVVIGFDARETSPAFAVAAARGAMDAGADVLDMGAVSTRPGADDVPEALELERVMLAIELVKSRFPKALIFTTLGTHIP